MKSTKSATHKIAKEVDHAKEGLKGATEKFWEDTKRESQEASISGSYDVSSPESNTDTLKDEIATTESNINVESSNALARLVDVDDERQRKQIYEFKEVSSIPEVTIESREVREIRFTTVGESGTIVGTDILSELGSIEPRASQTVTTVVTKSVRTATTPPPSPAEFSDNSVKGTLQ